MPDTTTTAKELYMLKTKYLNFVDPDYGEFFAQNVKIFDNLDVAVKAADDFFESFFHADKGECPRSAAIERIEQGRVNGEGAIVTTKVYERSFGCTE